MWFNLFDRAGSNPADYDKLMSILLCRKSYYYYYYYYCYYYYNNNNNNTLLRNKIQILHVYGKKIQKFCNDNNDDNLNKKKVILYSVHYI